MGLTFWPVLVTFLLSTVMFYGLSIPIFIKNVLMLKDTLDEVDEIEPFLESVICSVIAVLQGIFSIIMVVSQIKPAALWR